MEKQSEFRTIVAIIIIAFILLLLRSCVVGNLNFLAEAKTLLIELQQMAAEGGEVDQDLIAELIQQIQEGTEKALESAEDISDPAELQTLLEEISAVQDLSLEVFDDVLTDLDLSEDTEGLLADVIVLTEDEQQQVADAIEVATVAIENGEETVYVLLDTSLDEIVDEAVTVDDIPNEFDSTSDAAHNGETLDVLGTTNANENAFDKNDKKL